jgi:hypothetical protein
MWLMGAGTFQVIATVYVLDAEPCYFLSVLAQEMVPQIVKYNFL